MRLYKSKIPKIAMEVVSSLGAAEDIEVTTEKVPELEMDIRAILDGYVRTEERVVDEAKEIMERKGLGYQEFRRVKRIVSKDNHHVTGDDGLDWIINQMIECLMISPNVDEVYAEDPALRKKIKEVFDRNIVNEDALDEEVRGRLKHLEEGTPAWDIEYKKGMREVKRKHGLVQ
jgi:hypothetical protein